MNKHLLMSAILASSFLTACEETKEYDSVAPPAPAPVNTEISRDQDGNATAPAGFAVIFNLEAEVPEIPIVSDFLTAYPTAKDGKTAINSDDADGTLYMECQDTRNENVFINCSSVFAQMMKKVGASDDMVNRLLADDGKTAVEYLLDADKNSQTSTPIEEGGKQVFPGYNPVYSAIDDLDGFSTIAPFDVPLTREVDATTLAGNWYIVPVNYGDQSPKTGEPNRNDPLDKSAKVPAFEVKPVSYANFEPIKNNVLRFTPKEPLAADTRYLLVLTTGIKDTTGQSLAQPEGYHFMNGNQPFPPGSDPAAAAARAAIKDWMLLATAQMLDVGRPLGDIAMSYTFVTGGKNTVMQTISQPELEQLDQKPSSMPQARPVDFTGGTWVKLKEIKQFKSKTAQFITGRIELPYYLPMPKNAHSNVDKTSDGKDIDQFYDDIDGNGAQSGFASCDDKGKNIDRCKQSELTAANILLGEWQADQSLIYHNPSNVTGNQDGKALSKKISNFFPFPEEQKTGDKTLKRNSKLQVVAPASGCTMPADGYPVVIYQHDLYESRLSKHTIDFAEMMAKKCVATVAIDLPLHGVMPVEVGGREVENDIPLLAYSNYSETGLKIKNPANLLLDRNTFVGKYAVGMINGIFNKSATNEAVQILTRRTTEERFFGLTKEPNLGEIGYVDNKKPQNNIGSTITVDGEGPVTFPNFVPQAASQEYGLSGSLFINYLHFQTLRDNIRQAVLDLLNLNASLSKIALPKNVKLDTSKVTFVGKGMGAIVGSSFVALNNANPSLPKVQKAALIDLVGNLGGWLRQSGENPQQFGDLGKDMVDFYTKLEPVLTDPKCKKDCKATLKTKPNVQKGSGDYNTLMYMFQATLDSIDPVNYVQELKGNDIALYRSDNQNYQDPSSIAQRLGQNVPQKATLPSIYEQIGKWIH